VRPISLRVIARHYAAERQVGARCKTESRLWQKAEAGVSQATSGAAAAEAAAPALALCAVCTMSDACEEWARMDRYTGLAAGRWWFRGTPRRVKFERLVPVRRAS
jgi:hypothetical protein